MKLVYLNYKEPLKPVEEGFGYVGTLAQTEDGELVQCHICGELVKSAGMHAYQVHRVKAEEYRERFQLARRTPLCSDAYSLKAKMVKLEAYGKMTEEQREDRRQMMVEAQKKAVRRPRTLTTEELNRKGICPDQLLEKIQTCAKALNKTPTKIEMNDYYDTQRYEVPITRTFGSWSKAIEFAGLSPNKSKAGFGSNKPYTKEELIAFLKNYFEVHKVPPTANDFSRGFLPSMPTYLKYFGSIRNARKEAGLQEYISTRWKDSVPV